MIGLEAAETAACWLVEEEAETAKESAEAAVDDDDESNV